VATIALRQTCNRVGASNQAIANFDAAVQDERARVQAGFSTVIDLLTTEDRLTNSLLDHVASELAYARAVARLRYETGTLVDGANPGVLEFARFTTVPTAAP
jgi:outer membrane protein TolC